MTKQREAKLSSKIMDALRRRGAFCFKVHGSEYQMPGIPDILCCYKGLFVGFETKNPGQRENVSPMQAHVHDQIARAAGLIFVVCGVDEALAQLDWIDENLFNRLR